MVRWDLQAVKQNFYSHKIGGKDEETRLLDLIMKSVEKEKQASKQAKEKENG